MHRILLESFATSATSRDRRQTGRNLQSFSVSIQTQLQLRLSIDYSQLLLCILLILPGKNRAAAYDFLVDRFKSKLTCYKANKLSHAARLALIKLVFSSIPMYYMSSILLSKKSWRSSLPLFESFGGLVFKMTMILNHFAYERGVISVSRFRRVVSGLGIYLS